MGNRYQMAGRLVLPLFLLVLLFQTCGSPDGSAPQKTAGLSPDSGSFHALSPQTCRPCHTAIVDSFLLTGKGRSFFPASRLHPLENWKAAPVFDNHLNLYYRAFQRDTSFWIEEYRLEGSDTIHHREERIDFFVGSGNQTRSYLFERNGYLYEMPLTWYRKKGIWDLSPGYENGKNNRFQREIGSTCMGCHVSGFQPVPHSVNRYTSFGMALTCESCHGSMQAHLQHQKKGEGDTALLRLSRLPVQARLDVCRQCHLEGIRIRKQTAKPGAYKPGKLLSDYDEVFIPASGESNFGFASHAERLQLSACFIQSAGKLECISCHDPHSPISGEKTGDKACMSCHDSRSHTGGCNRAIKAGDGSCSGCHMAKNGTNDIPHVRSTDHWIRRKPNKETQARSGRFGTFLNEKARPEDKGKAILTWSESQDGPQGLQEVVRYLSQLSPGDKLQFHYLNGSFPENPDDTLFYHRSSDPLIRLYWSEVKKKQGLPYRADLEAAVRLAPQAIDHQFRLAQVRFAETSDPAAFDPVLALNPFHPQSLSNQGFVFLSSRDYARAEERFRLALKEDPDYSLAQENLARLLMETGRFAECKKIVNRLMRRFPSESRYPALLQTLP